jgi:hypothetical protein
MEDAGTTVPREAGDQPTADAADVSVCANSLYGDCSNNPTGATPSATNAIPSSRNYKYSCKLLSNLVHSFIIVT